ncbi:MAG: cell envelope integrity protein CreD [Bacteroidales bacterium]|nr:cell envelope integrity protein CreD [Bacteroidales bacterium]
MKSLIHNIYFKIAVIVFIAILLLLPSAMIMNLIREREGVQQEAIWEVSSKWGDSQTISGPFITIPYYRYEKQIQEDKSVKYLKYKEHIHLLPENLEIKGNINPEEKRRGIYEIVVYESDLQISGEFKSINPVELNIDTANILWDKAVLTIGISDLRGVENQVLLNWDNEEFLFNPGTTTSDLVYSGINANLPEIKHNNDDNIYKFSLKLDLKGSQLLYFTPLGKTTNVNLKSTWNNPKFDGSYITDSNDVNESGFTANWKILHLNRNFPQVWTNIQYQISQSAFGVNLILPVDSYQKTTRVAKYAILLIALTFLVFFFVEVIRKVFIHPIQYILVGIALIVFYTLLLSFSEHMMFNIAYLLSSVLTIGLITWYVKVILKKWNLTLLMTGILLILYSFIFIIIQIQDYALLIGSIGVFIILALVMYFSRKIDWGEVKDENKIEKNVS